MLQSSELEKLSLEDINLILMDQQELYSKVELNALQEYREYLLGHEKRSQNPEMQNKRRVVAVCPKCDGLNNPDNSRCVCCGHLLEDSEYCVLKRESDKRTTDDSDSKKLPIGRLVFGLLFSGAGVGAIAYGSILNDSIEAQMKAVLQNGNTNPGMSWIVFGAAAAVVGVVMLVSAWHNKL